MRSERGAITIMNRLISIATLAWAALIASPLMGQAGAPSPQQAALAPPAKVDVQPKGGQQGQTLKLSILGQNTHFIDGKTKVDFGVNSGVAYDSLPKVTDATHATVVITIKPDSTPGSRDMSVTTDSEVASTGFVVVRSSPALISITPPSAATGKTLDVNVVGQFTNFVPGSTKADFGEEIAVNSVKVTDSAHASVNLTILANATPGGRDVTITANNEPVMGHNGFWVEGVAPGTAGTGDDNPSTDWMNSRYIKMRRTLMAPKSVADTFGRRIGERYIALQITIYNRSNQYQWLIQDASVDLNNLYQSMKVARTRDGCSKSTLNELWETLNTICGPDNYCDKNASSADLTMLRGVAEKGQALDPRNFALHSLMGSGTIASGLIGVAKFGPSYAPAVAMFNGPLLNALQSIFPDYTVTQENRLSDSAYAANTVVAKRQAKVIAIFIPQEYLLTKEQRKLYWKDPEAVYKCTDLRLLNANVDGNFISTVTATPTTTTVTIASSDQALFQQDSFTIHGTIAGTFLSDATLTLADPVPAGLSVKLDGTPTDSLIKFILTGTKYVPPHTTLIFAIKGHSGDPVKATYEVNYNPAPPEPSKASPDCSLKAGDSVSVTVTGKNFIGDTKVVSTKAGLTPGAVTPDSSTQIKLEIAAAASAAPGTYPLRVMALGGMSTGSFSCTVTSASAAKAGGNPAVKAGARQRGNTSH
jgi:hypothetical protein